MPNNCFNLREHNWEEGWSIVKLACLDNPANWDVPFEICCIN